MREGNDFTAENNILIQTLLVLRQVSHSPRGPQACYVAQDSLVILISPPPTSKCWNHRQHYMLGSKVTFYGERRDRSVEEAIRKEKMMANQEAERAKG